MKKAITRSGTQKRDKKGREKQQHQQQQQTNYN
jgi:hypothetical protein